MSVLTRRAVLSKFRGTLTGVLMGDCLGAPFEMETSVNLPQVNLYLTQLFDPKLKVPYKPYTDDTAMTRGVAESLLEHKGVNPQELAKRFTMDYFLEPKRGYGSSVHDVFMNLRTNGFEDPFYAARKQFGGQGSLGNGAAMRVAPLALFAYNDLDRLLSMTDEVSRITHTHPLGVQGAILQALAIREALLLDPAKELDSSVYLKSLIHHMEELEKQEKNDAFSSHSESSYSLKLQKIIELVQRTSLPSVEEVQDKLGVGVQALHSVPTAIYVFLIARHPTPGLDCENQFLRSIAYSISLGGDTDTIGSMAAAISGAFLGYEAIPEALLRHCEKPNEILRIADALYSIATGDVTQNNAIGSAS